MQIIPVQAVPSQHVTAVLGGQYVQINLYQKQPYGLFMDVLLNNVLLLAGVICQNLNPIIRSAYLGFVGDLVFIDNQGSDDPDYTGLGARFSLAYLEASDLPAGAA